MNINRVCRNCDAPLTEVVNFGQMPIANAFNRDPYSGTLFNLAGAVCQNCWLFQLIEQPDAKEMFHDQYAFMTGTSNYMIEHFMETSRELSALFKDQPSFVLEIGSNDGTHLKNYLSLGCKVLGIEPSKNVCDIANQNGVMSRQNFFSLSEAKDIVENFGKADLVYGSNVMCHIPNISDIVSGLARVVSENGVIVFEDPYLLSMIDKGTYDQLYDEHVFMFSATSVKKIFEPHGLELFDCKVLCTHGGSMRYYLSGAGKRKRTDRLNKIIEIENNRGIRKIDFYQNFAKKCKIRKDRLNKILSDLKKEGKKIVGYGATSKSTTILNYCGINNNDIAYIVDNTPTKINKKTPVSSIPIFSREKLLSDDEVEVILLFAWNHSKEIMSKEEWFKIKGGIWVDLGENLGVVSA